MNLRNNPYKLKIAETFDQVADAYDNIPFFDTSALALIEKIKPENPSRILDITCGTGTLTLELAEKFPDTEVIGIDLSRGMLRVAKQKAKDRELKNVQFIEMDAERIEFTSNYFDLITCGYGLFFLPDLKASFSRVVQLLKPSGQFLFSTFTENAFAPLEEQFFKDLENFGVSIPRNKPPELKKVEEISDLLSYQNNIGSVEFFEHPMQYSIDVDQWWDLLNRSGYKAALNLIPEDYLSEFKEGHLNHLERFTENGEVALVADSWFTSLEKRR